MLCYGQECTKHRELRQGRFPMARSRPVEWLSTLALLTILAALSAYFLYAAVWGTDGLLALREREQRVAALEAELAIVQEERETLEQQNRGLSLESVDLDLLDERARAVLGYARPDELILIQPE